MATAVESNFSPLQKIAVLLASLNEETAASILQQLDPDVMTEVADEIAALGVISGEERQKAVNDCAKEIIEMGSALQGDQKTANSLLVRAIGEKRAAAVLEDRTSSGQEPFADFTGVPADEIAEVISNEQPGIIAIILRYLPVQTSGDILAAFSEDIRRQIMVFMSSSAPPSREVIARVEQFMGSRIKKGKQGQKVKTKDKVEVVAGILQHVGRSIEEEVMTAIEDKSADLANEIRDKLFTFDDIVKLSDVAMRRILSEIDTSVLTVALRNASIDLREKFFKNLSKRAAAGIKEEMEIAPKIKLSEVEENQRQIVSVIRNLDASGEIVIGEAAQDEYV